MQCLADFLVWRRPRVAELWLCLDPCWGRDAPEPSPGDRARVRGLACAVLALLSDQPFKLVLHSHLGADWMPRLPHVKDAAVQVYETDTDRECRAGRSAFGIGLQMPQTLLTPCPRPESQLQPPLIGWWTACRAWSA